MRICAPWLRIWLGVIQGTAISLSRERVLRVLQVPYLPGCY